MKWLKLLAPLALAIPALGQYAGPAILSRGEAPAAMSVPQISFRPFVELDATYDTGLTSASVTDQGTLASQSSAGVILAWGVSGTHSWKRVKLGLDYRGSLSDYTQQTYFDSLQQSLLLGLKIQVARHSTLNLRTSAGYFGRSFGVVALPQTVPFDPASTYIPTTDFFDNRTAYLTTQVDYILQKTARLSFDLGGDGFLVRRRSDALDGVTGGGARGDVQYRLTRRSTIGAMYVYSYYNFTGGAATTNTQGAAGTYALQISRRLELTGYAGFMRVESTAIQEENVDPLIAALTGLTTANQITHSISYIPNASARLSRTFHKGVAYVAAGHTVTPGNGLFLTSVSTTVFGGYTYTWLRRWSLSALAAWVTSSTDLNVHGQYGDNSGTLAASYQVARFAHLVVGYSAQRYYSADFSQYNRFINEARVGIGFTPGEVPLRIW